MPVRFPEAKKLLRRARATAAVDRSARNNPPFTWRAVPYTILNYYSKIIRKIGRFNAPIKRKEKKKNPDRPRPIRFFFIFRAAYCRWVPRCRASACTFYLYVHPISIQFSNKKKKTEKIHNSYTPRRPLPPRSPTITYGYFPSYFLRSFWKFVRDNDTDGRCRTTYEIENPFESIRSRIQAGKSNVYPGRLFIPSVKTVPEMVVILAVLNSIIINAGRYFTWRFFFARFPNVFLKN